MYIRKIQGVRVIRLPDGSTLSRADLPPRETRRWVASRKVKVVQAVKYGLISEDEALKTYDLSPDELESWSAAVDTFGEEALKTTQIQRFRTL